MTETAHERYTRLARELGGYFHPWERTLAGPDPDLTFDLLLSDLLTPQTRVLEAGCGHGPDAMRFGRNAAAWVAYDFVPELLQQARANAPHAQFHLWNGKNEIPAALSGPFDLIVSRRGPTSVILRMPELAASDAQFLYVGPRLEVPQVPERLQTVGWEIVGQWRVSVLAYAPTLHDWQTRCEWMEAPCERADWNKYATAQGMPYHEERLIVSAKARALGSPVTAHC